MTVTVITQRDPAVRVVPFTLTVDKDRDGAIRVRTGNGSSMSLSPKSVPDVIAALQKVAGIKPPAAPKASVKRPNGPQAYKGNGSHKWEEVAVDAKGAGHTYRLRVPGGWVYRTVSTDSRPLGRVSAQSTVFVPAPDVIGYAI